MSATLFTGLVPALRKPSRRRRLAVPLGKEVGVQAVMPPILAAAPAPCGTAP